MRIEPATMDEIDELADRWVELARGQRAYGSHLRPEANRASIRDALARGVVAGEVLVAREGESESEGGDGAGIAGFVTYGPEAADHEADVERGVVKNVYVRPDRRDEGIGSRLLAAAETRLADAGAELVSLEAMADNEDARRLYARRGYRPHRIELEKRLRSDTDTKEDR